MFLAVVAIAAVVSGCSGGGGSGTSSNAGDPGVVIQSGSPVANQGDASPGHCDGTIGRASVDEVTVPSGATCMLRGTRVQGNVSVRTGGTLVASAVTVDGDLQGENAHLVEVSDHSSIGGNLSLEKGGSAAVSDSHVDGDLQWQQQTGSLVVLRSSVGGNLQAEQNSGGLTISGNRIGGDLECQQNIPGPTGGDNRVAGHRAGQCAVGAKARKASHRLATHAQPQPQPKPKHVHPRPPCAGDSVSDDPSDDQCDGGGGA